MKNRHPAREELTDKFLKSTAIGFAAVAIAIASPGPQAPKTIEVSMATPCA
jgi:hypothetical protein